MSNQQIITNGINLEDFFDRMEARFSQMFKMTEKPIQDPKMAEYMSRKETASLLKISLPTLNDWTKRGLLASYRIGTRVLYKTEEVKANIGERDFKKFTRKEGGLV